MGRYKAPLEVEEGLVAGQLGFKVLYRMWGRGSRGVIIQQQTKRGTRRRRGGERGRCTQRVVGKKSCVAQTSRNTPGSKDYVIPY